MVEFVGTIIKENGGEGKWFSLKLIKPAIIAKGKQLNSKGDIKLSFEDKITGELKKLFSEHPELYLNKKRIIIKIED